ncbi:MAG: signal recognition particle-docking protein FtsY [Alphaproteobacteria bacterium]|nr:signal recognition particle-docking protein FtsY [Alphaproteobacteria bacterium]MCY4320481.1 signal recognition particle-docking protein FtsY [Alphaproteobacteria bacterium]
MSWLQRLKHGLSRSSDRLTQGIASIFTRQQLDDEALEELQDLLIMADLGPATAARLASGLARTRFGKDVSDEEVRGALAEDIAGLLEPVARPLVVDPARKPHVIVVVGVNGTGKTTTIGKFAHGFRAEGRSVLLAAGDTFRAAAVEQLQLWGERTGAPVVARPSGADAAGLVFDAHARAIRDGTDILLIDTAGRLHNKANLMDELSKIVRVIAKQDADAPHDIVLTLDATTGQNALQQVRAFRDMAEVTGLVVTKLDGSARGGVVVALAETVGLPVHAVGVGEGEEDLRPFTPRDFARSLMGLE